MISGTKLGGRVLVLIATLALASCHDRNVKITAIAAPNNRDPLWTTVDLYVPPDTFKLLSNRGDVYLFVNRCQSSAAPIEIGGIDSPLKQQPPSAMRPGALRFVLSGDFKSGVQSWSRGRDCAFIRTTRGYSPIHYRSNTIRVR